ncbi:ribosomal protein S18-alanine N-acetyltransferase [Limnohabitans sp. Rim8]|uniref:ribosomal protein S18-alanine N-acetyltransferase n=1 Tax=Limnohabitans sp. Rim8 TaxID=1100718 RepID=UPI0033058A50
MTLADPRASKSSKRPPLEVRFADLTADDLVAVIAVEQSVYGHPWTVGNFKDALASGYQAQRLLAGDTLIGYFVAMKVIDEVHLLNITVSLNHRSQGWARLMLDALAVWSRGQGCAWLWLEVRESNHRALQVYRSHGFKQVGLRKDYYPVGRGLREAALVMSQKL